MDIFHHIRYVPRKEIDVARWDACIANAANTILYGFHFYLDHMAAGQWDALVLGDYEAVMPLTWRRKYGIRYLYQPPFTQQTGIFAANPLPQNIIEAFLQTARRHFRFAEICLNYGNALPTLLPRTNYILSLAAPYEEIAKKYKKILTHKLKLANRAALRYTSEVDLDTALETNRREYGARMPHVSRLDHDHFRDVCGYLQRQGQLVLRAAVDAAGQPLSTVLLFRDQRALYLIQPTTPKAGRKVEANRFLLDGLIREWAGRPLLLDFEGSDIPGIASFYANFGGESQPYYFYRYNELPWPVNLIKR